MSLGFEPAAAVQSGGALTAAIAAAKGASWAPIVGPIVAGVSLAIGLITSRKRPRQKMAATQIVDELEPLLKQNLEGYLNGPRTKESQAQAVQNFDDAWAYLASPQACGNPELGPPGQWCIQDRARGGKWDWFALYRDPIANDPEVRGSTWPGLPAGGPDLRLALAIVLIVLGVLL